jgi:hypothetical protein
MDQLSTINLQTELSLQTTAGRLPKSIGSMAPL